MADLRKTTSEDIVKKTFEIDVLESEDNTLTTITTFGNNSKDFFDPIPVVHQGHTIIIPSFAGEDIYGGEFRIFPGANVTIFIREVEGECEED